MTEGRSRVISGAMGRLLPEPGEAILRRPEIVEQVPGETQEGVISPPPALDSTPTASGQTPRQERERAEREASSIISRSLEEDADGRSPDPRRSSSEAGTGGSAVRPPEPTDPRRTRSTPTASREAAPVQRGGSAPHFFKEQTHQVFYHDAIVYIEGQDVSPFLTGTISVSYGSGADFNKCDFTLDNAGHRFTITPENLRGVFRRSSPRGQGNSFDYDESIKADLFESKRDIGRNPVDPLSGGRRLPLHLWGSVFHRNDAVRVWIHNPASELDEWIPVFTGFIISKPNTEDYINGLNTVQVSCADIRHLMAQMRINTNTMLAALPGSQTSGSADPTNDLTLSGIEVFRSFDAEAVNKQFSDGFFQDLVRGSTFTNPWVSYNLPEMVAALTFLRSTSGGFQAEADARAIRDLSSARSNSAEEARSIAAELSPLLLRVREGGEGVLSAEELITYRRLQSDLSAYGLNPSSIDESGNLVVDTTLPELDEAQTPSDPIPPPGAEDGSTSTTTRTQRRVGLNRGSGRVGRMRPGVFPWSGSLPGDPPRTYVDESYFPSVTGNRAETNRSIRRRMQGWHNLCLFGTPRRFNFSPRTSLPVTDAAPDYSPRNRRYWTENEVRLAGRFTRREAAWHPEAQGVHFLTPGPSTPSDSLWDRTLIADQPVSQNLNWTNRLQMLVDACETADYRFWVSGSGDLIFEFAQYDFDPSDYGTWSEIFNLDHHLLNSSFDEEGGEVVTGVLANGSYVGLTNINEGNIIPLNPGRSLGVWSPGLASRLGLRIKVLNYSQITDLARLEQLATLEFQKLLSSADKYQIGLVFRPWLTLNRPVFNRYRERIALIDGLSWTLPVTAGAVAGQQPPSMNVTLNYSRSYDELGIPRYITGGPANPMYFAKPQDGVLSLVQSLQRRVQDFRDAITTLSTDNTTLTEEQFSSLQERYRAIIPSGQSTYNVINSAFLGVSDRPSGEEDPLVSEFRQIEAEIDELARTGGALTPEERQARLSELEARSQSILDELRSRNSNSGAEFTSAGARPRLGVTGVRSTYSPNEDYEPPDAPEASEEPSCSPGDPRFYSSPCGPATRTVPRWAAWKKSLRSSERRSVLDAYARGLVPDSDIDRGVGTWQFAGEFPRIVTSGFGLRNGSWHPGVDLPMDLDELVYAVSDGIVFYVRSSTGQGMSLGLIHADGFVTFYRHLNSIESGVSVGATVKRNQPVARVGFSGNEDRSTLTHLHFETGAISGSPVFTQYVGEGKRFTVVNRRTSLSVLSPVEALRIQGSIRVVSGVGDSNTEILQRWDPELVERFSLSFLRRRDGSLGFVSRNVLFYNPVPNSFPFSQAETVGRPGPDYDVISLEDYYSEFGLKGIPALRLAAEPTRFAPKTVPDIPPDVTGSRRRRLEAQRQEALEHNAQLLQSSTAYATARDQQLAIFADAVPPNECPPERYEGDIERQAGEPLLNRRRLTQETAEDARRRSS